VRIALLSDIHANLAALEAVLAAIRAESPDQVVCCGDIVGYGARPVECIDMVRSANMIAIAGNHDRGVTGMLAIDRFKPLAAEALLWTQAQLDDEHKRFLRELPLLYRPGTYICTHGSLFEPEQFHYLDHYGALARDFEQMIEVSLLFAGHTHIPAVYMTRDENMYRVDETEIELKDGHKYIVNVGSVGQPRDRDQNACWCMYDSQSRTVFLHRVPYEVGLTQRQIREAGLPEILATRLESGW
jgi:putative phosphoesterase